MWKHSCDKETDRLGSFFSPWNNIYILGEKMKMIPYCEAQSCCNTLGGEMIRTRDKKTRFCHLWVTWPKLFSDSPTELSFSWKAIVQILRMYFEFKFSLEHCDELAVSLSAPVRKIHAKKVKMILYGYFHLQKIEGLREFIICTAYIALRKRTHTCEVNRSRWSWIFKEEERINLSMEGTASQTNLFKPPSPCNTFVQSKEIHLQCKLSRFNYKMAFLLKSSSSKGNPLSEIGFYSSFEGMKRKWDVHGTNGQLSKISPGWWECCPSLESDFFYLDL